MTRRHNGNLPKYMTTVYFGNPIWFEELSRWAKSNGFTHSEAIRECIRASVNSEKLNNLSRKEETHAKTN